MKRMFSRRGQRAAWRSLTVQLLTFVIFPLVAVLVVITFSSVTLHEKAMRDLVGERDERAVQMAAEALDDRVQGRIDLINTWAALVSEKPSPQQAADIISRSPRLVEQFEGGLGLIDVNGEKIAFTGSDIEWQKASVPVQEEWNKLKNSGSQDPVLTQSFDLPGAGGRFAAVLVPLPGEEGAAVGIFSVSSLAEEGLSSVASAGHSTAVWLMERGGQVLYHGGSMLHDSGTAEHPGFQEAFDGQEGARFMQVEGSEHVIAFSPVRGGRWALMIEEPWEHVASPQLQITQMAPLIMVPVALLALFAVLFGVRQVVQPLQALAKRSEQLGWGDYESIRQPVGGIDEIRQLQMELIHMAHKVQSAQKNLQSYIGAITAGQEEERHRLARDLHDETIQSLIALKQRVQLAQMDWAGSPEAEQSLTELESATERAIDDVRRTVRALRPIYLEDLGLVPALNMLAKETGQALGIPVDFDMLGTERRLDGPVELSLYRIVQEALSNINRHAQASQAAVRIQFAENETMIIVEDNGRGFGVPKSPSAFGAGGHFGLLGMHERADLMNARLEIQSEPEQGTRVVVRIPA